MSDAGGRICVSISSEAISLEASKFPGEEVGAGGKSLPIVDGDAALTVDVVISVVVSCLFRKSTCRRTSNVSSLSPNCTSILWKVVSQDIRVTESTIVLRSSVKEAVETLALLATEPSR